MNMIELIQTPLLRVTLVFLAAMLGVAILRRTEPSWRIALIRGSFIGGLVLLFATMSGIQFAIPGWVSAASEVAAVPITQEAPAPATSTATPAAVPGSPTSSGALIVSPVPLPWGAILFFLWGFVAFVLLGRITITFTNERRAMRLGRGAPASVIEQWESVCREFKLAPRGLVIVPESVSPYLSHDGTLVLPAAIIDETSDAENLVHLLRHEAAHLKAGDHYWFPFLAVMTALLWFHPLAWWLSARHLISCEEARDAEAARLGGSEAYRKSVARVALGLLPSTSPSPSLLRKNGHLVSRLRRVEDTARQAPPFATAVIAAQAALIVFSAIVATAAPTALSTEQLFGMWRPEDRGNRFARQVEVYEWGDEVKMRIWHAVGPEEKLYDSNIASFGMTRSEFEEEISTNRSVSCDHRTGFSESIYSLTVQDDKLEFRVQTHYTDNSNRGDQDFLSYFVRGEWID